VFQLLSTRRRTWPLAFVAALTLLLIGMLPPRARAQDILQRTLATPNDGQPILLYADDVTTWADSGKQIFLLKGKVWIAQGALNVRANQAVVWVDQAKKKASGIYALEVYGEVVGLEDGKTSQASKSAFLQMGTRGEVRIKAYANKAVQQATPTDSLFARGLSAQKAAQPVPVPPPTPLAGVFMQDG
jgi:lipopolysaccharide export system protein LptA